MGEKNKHKLSQIGGTLGVTPGLHTLVRTHRTSIHPAYLHTYVYLYMKREEEECCYFWNPGLKRTCVCVRVCVRVCVCVYAYIVHVGCL